VDHAIQFHLRKGRYHTGFACARTRIGAELPTPVRPVHEREDAAGAMTLGERPVVKASAARFWQLPPLRSARDRTQPSGECERDRTSE
jgi:hypothetical protein